jgi:hypothetical protein
MLDVSNVYCYQHAVGTDKEDSEDEEIMPTHFPTSPCALVVVNQREYSEPICEAAERLRSDGLVVDIDMSCEDSFGRPTEIDTSEVSAIITKIKKAMRLCDHALFCSQIYAKPAGATFTYVRMMDVTSYLHKLLSNNCLREGVIKHFHMLEKFLSHPACKVIRQLQIDVNLVEVSNRSCFSVRNRSFRQCPIDKSMHGKISRLFHSTRPSVLTRCHPKLVRGSDGKIELPQQISPMFHPVQNATESEKTGRRWS